MRVFELPDLGEGLPDAEIVEWYVREGDHVSVDQPMVSMETAKAVVDVPSPFEGTICRLHGRPGDVIETGAPLVSFDSEEGAAPAGEPAQVPAESEGGEAPPDDGAEARSRDDSGTVVGAVESSDEVVRETGSRVGGYRVSPAVRALARKLGVDLAAVRPTGAGDIITARDVRAFVEEGPEGGTAAGDGAPERPPQATPAAGPDGTWEPIRGTRRTMARAMAEAHAAVAPTCITEDVDVALWEGRQDVTVRVLRALCAGAAREPGLNAWFDPDGPKRLIHPRVHAGIAVDTPDGLFVSTLRDADQKTPAALRADVDRLRANVANRSIPPEDLKGYTIILSNVGVYAGKYTTPMLTLPCVAIMATGRMRPVPVASHGGIAVHPVIPLSLTFDHRAVTGGEAARFLAAFIEDLALGH